MKEKLKAKQAEFEKELKKETKQLKPRVLGCLWLHECSNSTSAAQQHLQRVLSGYTAVLCTPQPQSIPCLPPTPPPTPSLLATPLRADAESLPKGDGLNGSLKRKFFKTFPPEGKLHCYVLQYL